MTPGFGLGELLVSFIAVAFSLALPLGILFLLYKIYLKVKNIEEQLARVSPLIPSVFHMRK